MWISDKTNGTKAGIFKFSKVINIDKVEKSEIKICADTKYRLLINDVQVAIGPCKKGEAYYYYDTLDITPFLKLGENVLTVKVLHLDAVSVDANGITAYNTLLRGSHAALMIDGFIGQTPIVTDDTWLVSYIDNTEILPPYNMSMAGAFEKIDYNISVSEPLPAMPLTITVFDLPFFGEYHPMSLAPSPIPRLTYNKKSFVNGNSISVENGTFVLDAGVHSTGTVRFDISGVKGSKVTLTYAEAYWQKDENGNLFKMMRDDSTGIIVGSSDQLILSGKSVTFETFYWRCFRYIEVKVEGSATLKDIEFYEMKYPLVNQAEFVSSDADCKVLWENSVRTLNNCMHDSFEDCPYFEQLQYAMDSRLQALFLRYLTDDKRLIKKCINDFNEARFPDGLTPSRTSTSRKQCIPGFALHYIFMLHDYMLYEREPELIKDLLPVVDGIIRWFEKHSSNGIVGPLGNWSYVDWVKTWTNGVPTLTGSIAVYNMMYIIALENASELAAFAGRPALSAEYNEKAEALRPIVKEYFYDNSKRMFKDSEEPVFSLHSQIWAVLAKVITGDDAAELLRRAYEDKALPVCSYSMMFFVFRAYEKVGLYDLAYTMLDKWRIMIQKHCTTWVEDDVTERSECHGWGSLPIYEFSACILGVKPTLEDAVTIKPYVYANDFAKGTVMTPIGKVTVDWKKENGMLTLTVNAPEKVKIILPDGSIHSEAAATLTCKI